MNHFLIPISILLAALTMSCGSSEQKDRLQPTHSNGSPETPNGDAPWALSYTAQCEGLPAESCVGGYGFSLFSDGRYQLGPAPQGQVVRGKISTEELESVLTLAKSFTNAASASGALRQCLRGSSNSERSESIQWIRNAQSVGTEPLGDCVGTDEIELRSKMHELARRYSPRTFPNPCIDVSRELDVKYEKLLSCEQDADCGYLDASFAPLQPDYAGTIVTDDCTFVRPVLAANVFEATVRQLEFIQKQRVARDVCGADLRRPACSIPSAIEPFGKPPVCVAGKCRVNPVFEIL